MKVLQKANSLHGPGDRKFVAPTGQERGGLLLADVDQSSLRPGMGGGGGGGSSVGNSSSEAEAAPHVKPRMSQSKH